MAEMVGEDFREWLQNQSTVLSVYWVKESEERVVEKAFVDMGIGLDCSVFVDLLLYEFTSY